FIWNEVAQELDYTKEQQDDKISDFYTDILLDSRFVTLGENKWDLRENHSFDKVHIDMNDIYTSDDVIELDEGLIALEDIEDEFFDEIKPEGIDK
ncbi:MAG: DNA-directed RNA polymerase subunit delta, partial [Bacilli bacterium]